MVYIDSQATTGWDLSVFRVGIHGSGWPILAEGLSDENRIVGLTRSVTYYLKRNNHMENISLNHLAIFLCAVMNLAIGGIWYSVLFGKPWMVAAGLTEEKLKTAKPAVSMTAGFLLAWLMAYNLAFFIGDPSIDMTTGALYGFLTGFGWVTLSIAMTAAFEMRPLSYTLINGGFMTVWFTLTGLILGAWR